MYNVGPRLICSFISYINALMVKHYVLQPPHSCCILSDNVYQPEGKEET